MSWPGGHPLKIGGGLKFEHLHFCIRTIYKVPEFDKDGGFRNSRLMNVARLTNRKLFQIFVFWAFILVRNDFILAPLTG